MRVFSVLLCTLIFSSTANAQYINIIKDLKTITDIVIQPKINPSTNQVQNNQNQQSLPQQNQEKSSQDSTPAQQPVNSSPFSFSLNPLSNYCEKINSSQTIDRVIESTKKITALDDFVNYSMFIRDSKFEIEDWVTQKLKRNLGISPNIGYPENNRRLINISEAINSCMKKNDGNKLSILAAALGITDLSKSFKLETSGGYSSINLNSDSNLILLAYAFDGVDDFMINLKSSPIALLEAEVINRKVRSEAKAEIEKIESAKKKKEDSEKAAHQKRLNEILATAQAYLNTPEGKLVQGYQYFQIIQLCHDLRKDYVAKYISSSEYSDYRTKIKNLEIKLKPSINQKNFDSLYSAAEDRNRNYQPFYPTLIDRTNGIDLFKLITNNAKGDNWLAAKKDCDIVSNSFRNIIDSQLGTESMKKNF